VVREPLTATTVAKDVVANTLPARCRVHDAIVTDVDRCVIDARAVVAEEQQIARAK
jgi:hypothetical protein